MGLALIILLVPGQPVSSSSQLRAGEAVTCASMGMAGHRLPGGAGALMRSCLSWGGGKAAPHWLSSGLFWLLLSR